MMYCPNLFKGFPTPHKGRDNSFITKREVNIDLKVEGIC